jgi:hypothetical protein
MAYVKLLGVHFSPIVAAVVQIYSNVWMYEIF